MDAKAALHHYLVQLRSDLLATLDGLDEYDVRRPLTPTGTNLLGLVKHVAYVQLAYFTVVFGRPAGRVFPHEVPGGADDDDLWVPAHESRADVVALHDESARRADETIAELPLDAPGRVPWWRPESADVTLARILAHVAVETARHAGHADILREGLDGRAGQRPGDVNVPGRTREEWAAYCAVIESAALAASSSSTDDDGPGSTRNTG
jgi:uncharacterized damage-inducible protein DinB